MGRLARMQTCLMNNDVMLLNTGSLNNVCNARVLIGLAMAIMVVSHTMDMSLALSSLLAIYLNHLISNAGSWNYC